MELSWQCHGTGMELFFRGTFLSWNFHVWNFLHGTFLACDFHGTFRELSMNSHGTRMELSWHFRAAFMAHLFHEALVEFNALSWNCHGTVAEPSCRGTFMELSCNIYGAFILELSWNCLD